MTTGTVEAVNTYSRGLRGKVVSILDNNCLPLVGGGFDGQVAKSSQFAALLPHFPVDIKPEEAGRLNVRYPQVLQALLLSSLVSGKESQRLVGNAYVEALGGEDFGNIAHLAMRTAALEPKDPETVIRVVYGGTNQMPLRALTGMLPALVYMDDLKKAGVSVPQLQIIFADHISSSANNHIDFKQARSESTSFAGVARKYIDAFFPDLSEHTLFLRDTLVKSGMVLGDELAEISPIVDRSISQSMRQTLMRKGNGNGTGVYYGSAHLMVHDIALAGAFVSILDDQPAMVEPKAIISIGGRQERDFYKLRYEVKPHLPERYRQVTTFQLFTRHQAPPYYMANDGDLALGQRFEPSKVKELEGIGNATRYDLVYLVGISSQRGHLQDFFERQVNRGTILGKIR